MKFQPYPFQKLSTLLQDIEPNNNYEPSSLTIGEPQFETPTFIQEALCESSYLLKKYPKTAGEDFLKASMRSFVKRRFHVSLKEEEIIPTFGTREVLFNFPQFFLHNKPSPMMAFTNPFYQIYEGAAIASNAKVVYISLTKQNNFKPHIDEETLSECDLVIINFPNNPTASTLTLKELAEWVKLALKYDFVLLNDECYSEIYTNTPPPSLLEASLHVNNNSFRNILVINSISKRSSAPGLRSGFIAGDAEILKQYMQYRTYVGCASPLPLQVAASKAWDDDLHVNNSREIYKNNFKIAKEILGITPPEATFYIWLEVENALEFTKYLYKNYNIKVLPGEFLSRNDQGINPGKEYIRIALVENEEKTKEVLTRVKKALHEYK
ncbi:MAG: succinyldiaminopimelate transaminase [Epsilonproteobacteria bacterium]|nr:succinyldiaminopimelate transaminase [Campylobacterota bacterium]